MNLVTIIIGLLVVCFYFYGFWELTGLLKSRVKENNISRRLSVIIIILYLAFGVIAMMSTLNVYGVAKLPVYNEMRQKLPEFYTSPERPAKPQSGGTVQPPSQPFFNEHKEQMDKLKRDGF